MLSRPEAIPPHIEGKRYRYNPLSFSSSIEIPFSRVDIPLAEAEKRPLAPLKKNEGSNNENHNDIFYYIPRRLFRQQQKHTLPVSFIGRFHDAGVERGISGH